MMIVETLDGQAFCDQVKALGINEMVSIWQTAANEQR